LLATKFNWKELSKSKRISQGMCWSMERREPSTLPVYAKANSKSAFTSMQSSQKTNRHEQSNKNNWRERKGMENVQSKNKKRPKIEKDSQLASCHRQTVLQGSNRSLPFLSELYFSPYSIMVAIFVLIPLNNVPRGRCKLGLIFSLN